MSYFDDVIEPSILRNGMPKFVYDDFPKQLEIRNKMNDSNFLWRQKDSKGFIRPSAMTTQHVFFTIRMIWNNTMPEEYRHKPVKLYQFDPFYTPEYFAMAMRVLIQELSTRDDLTPYFKSGLKYFRDTLEKISHKKVEEFFDAFEGKS